MSEIVLTQQAAPPNPPTGKNTVYINASGQLVLRDEFGGEGVYAPVSANGGGFIDGNFDSWQVNTTFSLAAATDTYTADMWVCNAGTGGAATVSQNAPAVGAEPVGMTRGRKYRLSHQQTTAATAAPTIGQKLEGVQQYNGQSITVSGFLAAAVAATLVTGIQVTQNFGTGGSPSASVVTTKTVSWAIGTTEARFSARVDIPSISGKTLGTGGNDFVRVDLLLATGATYTLYCSQMQIDVCSPNASADTAGNGGSPQPFRWAGLQVELNRIKRYVTVLAGTAIGGGWDGIYMGWGHVITSGAAGDMRWMTTLPVPMRPGTPALSYTGTAGVVSGQTVILVTGINFAVTDGTHMRGGFSGANTSAVAVGWNGAFFLGVNGGGPVSLIVDNRI